MDIRQLIKNKIKELEIKRINKKEEKKYLKDRKNILKTGIHSELIIERPDGLDRCSLILISYDTSQLKTLNKMLEERGIKSELLENFRGGMTDFKFNLTPDSYTQLNLKRHFESKLGFLGRMFAYGKPVEDLDFFTEKEQYTLNKWYKELKFSQ